MQTLATGTSDRLRPTDARLRLRGFSLLELMVVVTIIGIFVGVAVLSVGLIGDDRASEQEIRRLQNLVTLVREEAVMQSRDYGVLFTSNTYRFYFFDYDQQAWLIPSSDRLLDVRNLDEPMEIALVVDDRDVLLDAELDPEQTEAPAPQVMLLSTGEVTPFTVSVSRGFDSTRHTLVTDFDGTTEVSVDE
jgi:general secretion pathway protein H